MTKKEVKELYKEWRKANNNQLPNRVLVKMKWEDDDNTEKGYQIDTIALQDCDVYLPDDDARILYYAGRGIKGLLDLLKPNNGSDFIVTEVLKFTKYVGTYKIFPELEKEHLFHQLCNL